MNKITWVSLIFGLTFSCSVFAAAETAIFAGGCFWTMQSDFDKIPGVVQTTAGYTGGHIPNPSYEQVEEGNTGHYEAVKVIFDPAQISYQTLLNIYWHNIDPTNSEGQFCDSGNQYRSVIFYSNQNQMIAAEQSKQSIINSKHFNHMSTQIISANAFYPAEEYHQEFAHKNPLQYEAYKLGCGRDARLKELWQ